METASVQAADSRRSGQGVFLQGWCQAAYGGPLAGDLAGDQGELYLKNTLPGDLCTPNQIDCGIKILTDKATRSVMQTDLYEDKAALSMLETAPALVTWEIMKCRSRLKSSKIGALDGSPLNHSLFPHCSNGC